MATRYVEQVFQQLHSTPEIAFNEFKTSKFILEQLKQFNYTTEVIAETGIVATLDSGKPGLKFGVRTDIDALPFVIDGEKVNIHACGHDANASMVLAMAKEIADVGINKGKLFILFQPAEENVGKPKLTDKDGNQFISKELISGADALIQSGKIDELEELIGVHLRPIQEVALGDATPALVHGGGCSLYVTIRGVATHGARPHLGISSVDAAVAAVNVINAIRVSPRVPHSIKVTQLQTEGSAPNIIPNTTNMVFDIRAQNNTVLNELIDKAKIAVTNVAKAFGATAEFRQDGVPAADYNDKLVDEVSKAIKVVLGKSLPPIITPGCEDFHFYNTKLGIKTAYIGVGADLEPGLHNPKMTFNFEALTHGKDILKTMVLSKLQ